jgi:uncharacterized delta-60 repeat protein
LIASDGKIVVGGNAGSSMLAVRYNTNGTLDRTFSRDGIALTGFADGRSTIVEDMALQKDGGIVFAGRAYTGAGSIVVVARLQGNGAEDQAFGENGIVTAAVGVGQNEAWAVAVQSDQKIVIAGTSRTDGNHVGTLYRLNPSGTLDRSFDGDGVKQVAVGTFTIFADVAVLPTGEILTAGTSQAGRQSGFGLTRLVESKPVITSFIVPTRAYRYQPLRLSAAARDPNQNTDTLKFLWKITGPQGLHLIRRGESLEFTVTKSGKVTVELIVTDNEGSAVKRTARFMVH